MPSAKTSATVEYSWGKVDFLSEEWDTEDKDTEDKIKYINQLDAKFNNLPIEKIIEMTK